MTTLQTLLTEAGHLDEGHLPIFVFAWKAVLWPRNDNLPKFGTFFGTRAVIDRKITEVFGTIGLEMFIHELEHLWEGEAYIQRIGYWGFDFALVRVG